MHKICSMRGISAPTLTPMLPDGSINYAEYERLTDYITQTGVASVFVCGTTGEFVNLTLDERKQLLTSAKQSARAGTTVMFNATAMNLRDMQELIAWAHTGGTDAISVTAPYYHRYDAQTLVTYFCKVSEMAEDMPIYLYNMSGMTNNPITAPVLKQVAERCENVVGIKDSSMDFMTILEYQAALENPEFEIMTGNDAQVLTALQAGCAGGVIAMAGVFPSLCQSIWDHYNAGNLNEAHKAQVTVQKLRNLVRSVMPVGAHKAILQEKGFQMGPARFPFRELSAEERKKIYQTVEQLGL